MHKGNAVLEIALSQGKYALIDEEDAALVTQYRWHATRSPNTWYAASNRGGGKHARAVGMHRLILGVADKGREIEVDHIDGNGLNNTRANLRLATRAQNARNHKRPSNNTSGYVGVSWHKGSRAWCVQIRAHGQPIKVGFYKDVLDAARAYNDAAVRYYGAFARLNDVPPPPPPEPPPSAPPPPPVPPAPWTGAAAGEAESAAVRLGHVLGRPTRLAGVPVRQCSACLAIAVARPDGCYSGNALRKACRAMDEAEAS